MTSKIHRSHERGTADYGWLKARYSFSFAQYHNPGRVHFGVLRVLNDDHIAPTRGFDTHPHDNMEIITIPLEGELTHQDSMGHQEVIKKGDVQVMSAGTGILHSEFNGHATSPCDLFQIWILPNERGVEPRYDQASYDQSRLAADWVELVHPKGRGDGLWIHQDAWIHMTQLTQGEKRKMSLKSSSNGLFIMVISGSIQIGDDVLHSKDEMQLTNISEVEFTSLQDAHLLTLEVPLSLPRIR